MFIKALGGFFAIMNPFLALPLFLSLTEGETQSEQRAQAAKIAVFTTIFCAVILLTGQSVLSLFGISVDDFRVAGGIVLMIIALGMLNGSGNSSHSGTAAEQSSQKKVQDVSFYPMTFPIIAGPGTITTLIIFAGQAKDMSGWIALVAALALVLIALAVVLWFAGDIGHHMSMTLRTIVTRLMGMILAAIAVSMIAEGLTKLLPGLAG
ncbi:MarC family protein [Paracoccus fistulariae]|uniref:MarC family protein n=1 Tax=Paracoccus fistulariae TaxID=658446 RepID=UPI00232DDC86|nr:MarC family protein [Paracoccus fistulariae]MDB6180117.1 MarC family protein [Paracoccus fistulariae]